MTNTYGDLKARIASDLERDLTQETTDTRTFEDEVEGAITDAISLLQSKQYWFLQQPTSTAKTATTTASNSYVTEPTGLLDLYSLRITVNSQKQEMDEVPFDEMESLHDGADTSTGQPFQYNRFGQRIRVYPIPNDTYTLTFSGLFTETAMSADSDSSAWSTVGKGELLCRSMAKLILIRDFLKSYKDVPAAQLAVQFAEQALDREHIRRTATRKLKARC